jgi:hypothetical protein
MNKDKEVKKNVKNIFLSMCDVNIFLTFTSPNMVLNFPLYIRVITKLPNSEQFYKGKVKTHNYINRQNLAVTRERKTYVKGNVLKAI